jgi:hypothetical protein
LLRILDVIVSCHPRAPDFHAQQKSLTLGNDVPVDRFSKRSNLRPSKPQSTVTGFLLQFCHMPVTVIAFVPLAAGGLLVIEAERTHMPMV